MKWPKQGKSANFAENRSFERKNEECKGKIGYRQKAQVLLYRFVMIWLKIKGLYFLYKRLKWPRFGKSGHFEENRILNAKIKFAKHDTGYTEEGQTLLHRLVQTRAKNSASYFFYWRLK